MQSAEYGARLFKPREIPSRRGAAVLGRRLVCLLFVVYRAIMAPPGIDAAIVATHWQINVLLLLLLWQRRVKSRSFWVREVFRLREQQGHGSVLIPILRAVVFISENTIQHIVVRPLRVLYIAGPAATPF